MVLTVGRVVLQMAEGNKPVAVSVDKARWSFFCLESFLTQRPGNVHVAALMRAAQTLRGVLLSDSFGAAIIKRLAFTDYRSTLRRNNQTESSLSLANIISAQARRGKLLGE